MTSHTWFRSVCTSVGLLILASGARGDTPPKPGIDLLPWKLTLPVGPARKPLEIAGADLARGYASEYFYRAQDGAWVFWAPVTGTTTTTSHFPRSELRETRRDGTEINWREADGVSVLSATCAVLQVPSTTGKTVIGQIHAKSVNLPLLKLSYQKGEVVALVKMTSKSDADTPYKLCAAPIGQRISYQIRLDHDRLSVTANGKTITAVIAPDWQPVTLYFKAGNYVQANSGSPTDGGRVAFYDISVSHTPFAK